MRRRERGCCVALLVTHSFVAALLAWLVWLRWSLSEGNCAGSADNIAGKAFPGLGCAPQIDVVYTWVNGTDPLWRAKMEALKEKLFPEPEFEFSREADHDDMFEEMKELEKELDDLAAQIEQERVNRQGEHAYEEPNDYLRRRNLQEYEEEEAYEYAALRAAYREWEGQAAKALGEDFLHQETIEKENEEQRDPLEESAGENRFRDNEELRFSLRSLERFAPWVRHVFLVTDNQIPSWLDLSNSRLTVVPHTDIFMNGTDLPTFSSPAIEANLHRIKGLAKKFIYFNDDVMLGAPVWPWDFFDERGAQKIYLAWPLPSCSEGCVSGWRGDGFCDSACNVEECNFDGGDCEGREGVNSGFDSESWSDSFGNKGVPTNDALDPLWRRCSKDCRAEYLADGFCDRECALAACGWDGMDCFLEDRPPGMTMPYYFVEETPASNFSLFIPVGTRALGVNFSRIEFEGKEIDDIVVENDESILRTTFHTLSQVLNIVFANPGSADRDHLIWGGSSLDDVITGNASSYFSAAHQDTYILGGCDEKLGCESFESLNTAMSVCSLRGRERCGGVTGSNRFEKSRHFELRKYRGLVQSKTYETSWVLEHDLEKTNAGQEDSEQTSSKSISIILTLSDSTRLKVQVRSELAKFQAETVEIEQERDSLLGRRVLTEGVNQRESTLKRRYAAKVSRFESVRLRKLLRHGKTRKISVHDGESVADEEAPRRRNLIDTFGGSLLHVNKLYDDVFGSRERRAVAHMPHFIDVDTMKELQAAFPDEWERTSSGHFRSKADMQFSFSYMYWVIHQGDKPELSPQEFFSQELDTDNDGKISLNELRTLAALHQNRRETPDSVTEILIKMLDCIDPEILGSSVESEAEEDEESSSSRTRSRVVHVDLSFEDLMKCEMTQSSLVNDTPRKHTHELRSDEDSSIAFQMLVDDPEETLSQLDSVRSRRPKFICVNDNMRTPTQRIEQDLRNFQLAFFPHPSQFELALDRRNRFLYFDEYLQHLHTYNLYTRIMYVLVVAIVFLLVWPSFEGEGEGEE